MRVLLFSSNTDDKKFFAAVAAKAGFSFSEVDSAEKLCSEIESDSQALVVVDASTAEQYAAFEKAVSEKLGLYSAALNPNTIFFVSSKPFHECLYLARSDIFGHFIERTFKESDQDFVVRLMKMAVSERAFGFNQYFSGQTRLQTIKVTQSLQKRAIVESLKDHLVKIGFKPRIAMVIASASDELIMNAIFDAPVDETGKHIYAQTLRSTAFDLVDKNIVEVTLAFDGKIFGVSVLDNHGSLDKKKLLSQHLGKSYTRAQYEARTVTAGAGLGLAQVYRNSGGLIFASEAGSHTEVSIFFKKTDSFRDFKDQFRFLSTFMYF